jgi:hypothetical protein
MLQGLVLKGAYRGVETPLTPDEPGAGQPDVLDGGDVVDGAGGDGLASSVACRFDYLWSIATRLISCVNN